VIDVVKDAKKVFSTLAIMSPFAYPLLMMPVVIREDLKSWAGTNGVTFFINPTEWEKLDFRQKLFISMHEWIHIVMQHAKCMQGRRQDVWIKAADFAANDMIMNEMEDRYNPPPGILYDPDLFYNKTAEEIYSVLLEMIQEEPEPDEFGQAADKPFLNGSDAVGQIQSRDNSGNDLEPTPSNIDDQNMVDAIIKAAARAKGMKRGYLPGSYEDYINQLKKSDIPWERILFRFSKQCLKGSVDRNPFKPDPKYLPFDIIIPTEESQGVGKLVFIVDTSGSMETKEFEYVCGHLEKLGSIVDKCMVITADTKVQDVFRVKRIKRELAKGKIKFRGRGGTNMNEAFALAEKMNPQLIILYSDMFIGDFPPKPKRAQTIFLATKNSEMESSPYGIFIKMQNAGRYGN